MRDFYEKYYDATRTSRAHAEFCRRSFGADFCQNGFADLTQLDLLLSVTALRPTNRVLELGCGNGLITEYLSDQSGAHITGLDYIHEAIRQARERTLAKADRLTFQVGDMDALDLAQATYDTILSIDTLYFPQDLAKVIGQLKTALTPGGQMGILYTHCWEPWVPKEQFDPATLPADKTPLGVALVGHELAFVACDLTQADYQLARRRKRVLADLKPEFEAEGLEFIFGERWGDANGIMNAIEAGLHRRYLYHVTKSDRAV